MSVVTPHGIASWARAEISGATFQEAEAALSLMGKEVGDRAVAGPGDLALRRESVKAELLRQRLAVEEEGEDLILMGGVVRLRPPYCAESCASSNSAVLGYIPKSRDKSS